jgi:hypothetical protein
MPSKMLESNRPEAKDRSMEPASIDKCAFKGSIFGVFFRVTGVARAQARSRLFIYLLGAKVSARLWLTMAQEASGATC